MRSRNRGKSFLDNPEGFYATLYIGGTILQKPRKPRVLVSYRVEKLEDVAHALLGLYKYVAKDLKSLEKRLDRLEGVKPESQGADEAESSKEGQGPG